jgi:hypothetical protein
LNAAVTKLTVLMPVEMQLEYDVPVINMATDNEWAFYQLTIPNTISNKSDTNHVLKLDFNTDNCIPLPEARNFCSFLSGSLWN